MILILNPDRPISDKEEDFLEGGKSIDQLASWVHGAPMQDGFVIGVTGSWGSGKTSVLNMLAERIGEEPRAGRVSASGGPAPAPAA